jgi:hypothetical protein
MTQNIENIEIELVEQEFTELHIGFTRYLYVIDDVKSSLMLSIMDHQRDEALYWAYELYFSGIQLETFCLLQNMAYTKYNAKCTRFVDAQKQKWQNNRDHYWILGTIVWYLCERPYSIGAFIKEYCNDQTIIANISTTSPTQHSSNTPRITVILEEKDVMKYVNMETTTPRYLLTHPALTKYRVRNYCASIFENDHAEIERDTLLRLYREHWMYFACASPLWWKRIRKHGGKMDHVSEIVVFDEDDTRTDTFYEKYYYDTDEQPSHIMELRFPETTQWTWDNFCDHYLRLRPAP